MLDPPIALVLGFFDAYGLASQQLGARTARVDADDGRQPRSIASLPGSLLGCPAWFAGDAVRLAGQARRGSGRC